MFSITCQSALAQFPTDNPIPGAIPQSDLVLRLEPVIQIPNYLRNPPRLERLTDSGDGSGNLFVHNQNGPMYRFQVGDAEPQLIANFATGSRMVVNVGCAVLHFIQNTKIPIPWVSANSTQPTACV